jgi:hypothetical protein
MQLSWDIVVYLLGIAVTWGSVLARLKALEKKMDRHNNLVERMVAVEASAKSAHHRLDENRDEAREAMAK